MLRKCQLMKAEPRRGSRLPLRFFHNFRVSSLLTCLFHIIIIIAQLPFTASAPTQPVASSSLSPSSTSTRRNEMLVPLNSTTALICEPVFHAGGQHAEEEETAEARWMRDGREVARVSGHSNAVIGQLGKEEEQKPPAGQDPIPEIGFLVIRQTQREDQGDYWCERTRDGVQGERTRLRVAFLEPFAAGQRPDLATPVEGSGQLVILDCPPRPNGVPPPILSWQLNGERITDFPALKLQVAPNGSLLISDFSAHQSGFYACEAANFVSKSVSEPLFLAAPLALSNARKLLSAGGSPSSSTTFVHCLSAYVRNGVLWFLIGCLSTSCVVLAYILGALFLHRLYSLQQHQDNIHQNNNNNINNRWRPSRSLFAGPGFRKVVAPMAEPMGGQAMPGGPPPPYESASESGSNNSRHNSDGNSREQFDV